MAKLRIKEMTGKEIEMIRFKVMVFPDKGEKKGMAFKMGSNLRRSLKELRRVGFRVYRGLCAEMRNLSFYVFWLECPLEKKDLFKKTINCIAELKGIKS